MKMSKCLPARKLKLLLLFTVFLSMTLSAFCQQEQMLSLRKFSGLNTKDASHNIDDDQLVTAENVFIEAREIRVRGGYERFNVSTLMGYGWTDESVEIVDNANHYISIDIDSNNYPHISYYDVIEGDLKYAKWNGTAWNISAVDSAGNEGYYSSIVVDSNNYPHISYWDVDPADENLKYAKWDGSNWIITTIDITGDVGQYSSIVVDSNNYPHISYQHTGDTKLKYAKWDGVSWSTSTLDNDGDTGHYTSIVVDSNDYPHISYFDATNTALKYAKWNGIIWSTTTIDSTGNVGHYSTIDLDSNDYPHISYQYATGGDLKYAQWNGVTWSTSTVDSTDDVGRYSSIALDSDDYPSISYYDATNTTLEYAEWDGSSWTITTVDSADDVGAYSTLVLDSKDYPHIAYYDATNKNLEYATYTELDCEPIRFLDEYTQSDGDKFLMMVYGSTVCYSVHKDSFTVLLGTMSDTADYWGEAYNDNYYIGNQTDGYYKFNGSAFTLVSASIKSLCSLCVYDKIYLGNQSGEKSKVIYSNIGDAETFPGDQYLYINRNDGDEITGIGMLSYPIVFKSRSMWRLINTDDAYSENDGFICISPSVGAVYGSTIQEKDGLLYFMSERGIEVTDGISVKKISDIIDGTLEDIVQKKAVKGFWKQTTKEHFKQGTYGATTLDLETLSDSMYIKPQTTLEDFQQGTSVDVDTTTVSGDIVLSPGTSWIVTDTSQWIWFGGIQAIRNITFGNLNAMERMKGVRISLYLKKSETYTNTLYITLHKTSTSNPAIASWSKAAADLTTTATWYNFDDETVALDPDINYSVKLTAFFGNIYFGTGDESIKFSQHPYKTTGNFTSQYLNFGSTPTSSGYFVTEETKPTGTNITYQVQNATSSDGAWSSLSTIVNGTDIDTILTTPKQYLKWKATLTTTEDFETPTLSAIWQGSCFQSLEKNAGSDWTSWGLFESVGDFPSGTDMSYQIRTSTYSGGTASESWQTITNLYEIENSTGPYIQFRANLLRALETQSPRIDSLTVNWYDSAKGLRPVSAVVDERIWWAVKKKEDDYNQTVLVLDENGQWSEFTNFPAASFTFYKYNLYFGSSNDKGYIYRYDNDLTLDDTADIEPKIKTKSFDMKAPFNDKEAHRLWLYYAYNTIYSNSKVKYCFNDSVTEEKEIEIDLTTDKGPIRARVGMPIGQRFRYISLEISDFTTFFGFDLIHSILSEGER